MVCPVCGERLRTIDRSGVEIDICPACKGVWLDRGELEKLIALEATMNTNAPTERMPLQSQQRMGNEYDHYHDKHHDKHHGDYERQHSNQSGRNRRGSWLGDILGGFGDD